MVRPRSSFSVQCPVIGETRQEISKKIGLGQIWKFLANTLTRVRRPMCVALQEIALLQENARGCKKTPFWQSERFYRLCLATAFCLMEQPPAP
jgi:hypothetical protein